MAGAEGRPWGRVRLFRWPRALFSSQGVMLARLGVCRPDLRVPRPWAPMLGLRWSTLVRLTGGPRPSAWLLAGLMAYLVPPLTMMLMPRGSLEPRTNRSSPPGGRIPPVRWMPGVTVLRRTL